MNGCTNEHNAQTTIATCFQDLSWLGLPPRSSHDVSGGAACRAASEHGGHAQRKHISNGPVVEATQLQHMQRRLAAAEADAEGARMELLRACQRAEAAAADVARCRALDTRLQVLLLRIKLSSIPMYIAMPLNAD